MRTFRVLLTLIMLSIATFEASAEDNYQVTAATALNVRSKPTTKSRIVGKLRNGTQIEVINISNGWAKFIYNGVECFINAKYITPLQIPEKEAVSEIEIVPETEVQVITQEPEENSSDVVITEFHNHEVDVPLSIGVSMSDAINLYLAVQGGLGWSNFIWDNGNVNGTMAYSGNVLAQLYFEKDISFIPHNWYSEASLGYNKLGAANFDMDYIHLGICPFGYRFSLDQMNLVIKGGVDLAYPLNELSTAYNSWSADFQCGAILGLQIEYGPFALGCDFIYDATEVAASCGQKLYNSGVFGTLTYKFAKFGHKR